MKSSGETISAIRKVRAKIREVGLCKTGKKIVHTLKQKLEEKNETISSILV